MVICDGLESSEGLLKWILKAGAYSCLIQKIPLKTVRKAIDVTRALPPGIMPCNVVKKPFHHEGFGENSPISFNWRGLLSD